MGKKEGNKKAEKDPGSGAVDVVLRRSGSGSGGYGGRVEGARRESFMDIT